MEPTLRERAPRLRPVPDSEGVVASLTPPLCPDDAGNGDVSISGSITAQHVQEA
jgi:hypothetical protein